VDEEYLTLKLTLAESALWRYHSRIEQSPAGASSEPDPQFDLAEERIKEWVGPLAKGTASRQDLVKLGQELFALAIHGPVLVRYQQCVALAQERGTRLRIALSVRSSRLIPVPWEYMYDGQSFLLKRGESVVRVLDELPETPGNIGPVKRPLLAVANPADQEQFDAEEHLRKLREALGPGCRPEVRMPADADAIRKALLDDKYDCFYFVGHGRFTEALEGQLVVEGPGGESQYLDADRLAEWTREGQVRFAYLNACSGARTGVGNPFTGVAQRLMRDGEVACVVAMQAPIAQRAALKIAEEFFTDLQKGHGPEVALARSRTAPDDFATWGLLTIYTRLVAPAGQVAAAPLHRQEADPGDPVVTVIQRTELPLPTDSSKAYRRSATEPPAKPASTHHGPRLTPGHRGVMMGLVLTAGLILLAGLVLGLVLRALYPPNSTGRDDSSRFSTSDGADLVAISGGTFTVGSDDPEDDNPKREVRLAPFYIGAHEVTQRQFAAVMGYNPSYFSASASGRPGAAYPDSSPPGGGRDVVREEDTESYPVENVSWVEARKFCQRLTEREHASGGQRQYRLPTEEEWEVACRAGTSTKYYSGDLEDDLKSVGWYEGNSKGRTYAVGSKNKNAYGLYDTHGNVWEWCSTEHQDPDRPGPFRIVRGGCWLSYAAACRSTACRWRLEAEPNRDVGLRVACDGRP
jgi:formylglycine-generating enzyme required for sulfatase activity